MPLIMCKFFSRIWSYPYALCVGDHLLGHVLSDCMAAE